MMEGNGRPSVDVTDKELHQIVDDAWAALAGTNDPPKLFRRGDVLSFVATGDEGSVIKSYQRTGLTELMSRSARWYRRTRDADVTVHPPEKVAKAILEWQDTSRYSGVPRLDRVARAPFFALPGGKSVWDADPESLEPQHGARLVTEPGYHEDLGVLYNPYPEFASMRLVTGADDDFGEAVRFIRAVFDDFPFVGRGSEAHAWSLLLLPFVRELIDGDTPLYLIDAPEAGTGKGLLTDVCLLPSVRTIPRQVIVGDEDEWRKTLTAALIEGPPVILIDNVPSPPGLSSPGLAAVLTAEGWWTGRILGLSRMATVPIRNVWVATGNNVTATAEHSRRVARIRLDRGMEDPTQYRKFRIPNLRQFVRDNRAELAWAALTVIQNWLDGGKIHYDEAGNPVMVSEHVTEHRGHLKESYREWSRVMGGILRHAGVEGFLEQESLIDTSERDELGVFFEQWAEAIPMAVTKDDLARKLQEVGTDLNEHLPSEMLAWPPSAFRAKIGYWLRSNKNRVAAGYKLVNMTPNSRVGRWIVTRVD